MNRSGSFISAALVAAIPFLPLTARDQQDKQDEKGKKKALKIQSNYREFDIPEINIPPIEIDLSELEFSLKQMEVAMMRLEDCHIPDLVFELSELPPIEIPEINIPPIAVAIPAIPPIEIPPIVIPDIALGDLTVGCDVAAHQVFHDLSEEEQVRLQALRTLACKGADQAITAYQQVQKQKARPAFRYEAIRQLGHFLDDARVLPLIAEAAKTDKNIEVRKKAIALLGKSRDPRSTKILEEILLN
jgi:hypothetical protein